tara:strand:- start:4846 stop:6462 length:1617 start_codon:yes stop_codon:yes gene_type:complete
MLKKTENFFLSTIIIFIFYCAIVTGSSWDELPEMNIGKERLKYLFSLGSYQYFDFINTRFYPGFYNTIAIFFTKMFPSKYEIEIWHLLNSFISILTVFGIYKISSELFNKQVGKIVFLLCILNPIFFGHMAINSKDTIIAFANIWSTYLIIKYFKNQSYNAKRNRYTIFLGLCIGFGLGTRIAFLTTLLPIIIFSIIDIFYLKIFTKKNFSLQKLLFDCFKIFLISYFIMISCWPQTHENIFILPIKIFFESISSSNFGVPIGLLNGSLYFTDEPPFNYIIVNLFYKTPEFILLLYIAFIFLILMNKTYFKKNFNFFNSKIILLIFILLFPNILILISPYSIYDGLRLFLYLIPYFSIIPAISIYYLIKNSNQIFSKIILSTTIILFIYYIFIFVLITPYQYTYLNRINGDFSNAKNKFENDYWAISLKELIKKIPKNNLTFEKEIKIAFCGLPHNLAKRELEKINGLQFVQKDLFSEEFDFVMMTNKTFIEKDKFLWEQKDPQIIKTFQSCFDKFKGKDLISVNRNGLILSTLRKVY